MVVLDMLSQDSLDVQHCVAKALYDNIAESPDELPFRKGDILSVLEQNTGGIEGWWLCSLRGRQGICPGNRLRILPGVYEVTDAEISIQNFGKRRSWHVQPNMVLTPQKFGDVYLYDLPPGHAVPCQGYSNESTLLQTYDIPRPLSSDASELTHCPGKGDDSQCYDTPRPIGGPLTPSSSASSLTAPESLSLPSSNRSSLLSGPEYDVPKQRTAVSVPIQIYDIPAGNPKPKELPLELSSALETLSRLQTEADGAVQKLLGLVTPTWRNEETLVSTALEIKLAALRLRTAVHELAEFCEGSLGNAQKAPDAGLATKLSPMARILADADRSVQQACAQLDSLEWSVRALAREADSESPPDSLEQLVAVARALTEDVRRATSFLQGNAPLLFRKDKARKSRSEDYDYVSLDNVREILPHDLQPAYDTATAAAVNEGDESDDARLLKYFAGLALNHISHLTQAIDAFLLTVEQSQPPKIFLAHGKLVVLSAHRLVHVGDTVARNVTQTHIKQRVQEQADNLSHALDQTVQRTKRAAQHFPSVAAVQDMVDAVLDVSHFASDLRRSLVHA